VVFIIARCRTLGRKFIVGKFELHSFFFSKRRRPFLHARFAKFRQAIQARLTHANIPPGLSNANGFGALMA
jgi:hypothetical protein